MNKNKVSLINGLLGTIGSSCFTVDFVKKDGSPRTMNCRLHVSRGVSGGRPDATAARKDTLKAEGMICVFDMAAAGQDDTGKRGAFRTIDLNTVTRITAKGETLSFL